MDRLSPELHSSCLGACGISFSGKRRDDSSVDVCPTFDDGRAKILKEGLGCRRPRWTGSYVTGAWARSPTPGSSRYNSIRPSGIYGPQFDQSHRCTSGLYWLERCGMLNLESVYLSLSERGRRRLGRGPQLSSCGHIFCNSCVLEFHESSGRCCCECGAKCELLPISPQMTKYVLAPFGHSSHLPPGIPNGAARCAQSAIPSFNP